jgi:signal transduction histidine kinase
LDKIVREVVASRKSEIDERPLEIICDTRLPATGADRRLVKLAFKQLLDNALKYSPSGTPVTIRVFDADGTIAVEVMDHGNGIPAQEQSRIFQRFYRSASVKHQIPGSGLGLSIAHSIVRAHGGDLTVKSRPGETIFRMTFPVQSDGERS